MPEHTPDALREWLGTARGMWLRYVTEFAAVNQAMTVDPHVLAGWQGLIRRVKFDHAALHLGGAGEEERAVREAHMTTLMMGLERTFYSLYIRGHKEREELILTSLARQWARMFDYFPRSAAPSRLLAYGCPDERAGAFGAAASA